MTPVVGRAGYSLGQRAAIAIGGFLAVLVATWAVDKYVQPVPTELMSAIYIAAAVAAPMFALLAPRRSALAVALVLGVLVATIATVGTAKDTTAKVVEGGASAGSSGLGGIKAWIQKHVGGDDR